MEQKTAFEMFDLITCSAEKWLLIGATEAGRGLYCALKRQGQEAAISMWTDKKHNFYRMCGLPIDDPEKIGTRSFDRIILSSESVCQFFETLSAACPLDGHPTYVMYGSTAGLPDFPWNNPKYTDNDADPKDLVDIDPHFLINEKRLDIVIRYIACREIMAGTVSDGVKMYKKLILSMNDGEEYVHPFTTCSYFSSYSEKKGVNDFLEGFSALIGSMQKNGFSPRHYIPLSPSYGVINGTHRIAAALALGINVYAKIFVGFGEPFLFFKTDDLKRIGCTDLQLALTEKTCKELMNRWGRP